jgi:hypothetical protein
MWLNKVIRVGDTNQFDTNTCHHNKKLDWILDHLHLFWDFPKSPINEYNDFGICSWSHTKPHNTQINIGVLLRKLTELQLSTLPLTLCRETYVMTS